MGALVNDVTPNRRSYTLDGRLGALIVRGGRLTRDVAGAVLTGSVNLSTDGVTQLELTLADPGLRILASQLFTPGDDRRAGSRVDYGRLRLECAAVEVEAGDGGAVLTVTARSLGAQKLRRVKGAGHVRHKQSPTRWAALEAKAAGLRFVGQPSSERRTIGRRKGETSWDALQRLAEELGYVCFEAAGVLYFGRPSWLADQATGRLRIDWKGTGSDPRVLGLPRCRRTGDNPRKVAEVEVDLAGALGDDVTPGHRFTLDGVPTFDGRYLVDSVTIPLDDTAPVTVSASTPVNPVPQPPDPPSRSGSGGSGAVSAPPVGRLTIKHVKADRDQLANATTIYRVGAGMGIGAHGLRVAMAAAIQESVMRNLSGGDRDSVGLFQQRASWGSFATRHDPAGAARLFFNALKRVPGWENKTVAAAAQAVQRSAFPSAYAQWSGEAAALVDAIAATRRASSSSSSSSGRATGGHSAGAFVTVALRQAGDRYVWAAEASPGDPDPDAFDCSELVQWALARVGVRFVDGSSAQIAACRAISVAQAIRTRGALLYHPGHIAISLGNGRTIEAANSRVGVVSYSAAGRFTRGGLVPGLAY